MTSKLSLTDEQAESLKEVVKESESNMQTLTKKASEASQALKNALYASEYDATKVKSLATTAQTAEAAIVTARIDVWTQIRSILSASQVSKLKELMNSQPSMPGQGSMTDLRHC